MTALSKKDKQGILLIAVLVVAAMAAVFVSHAASNRPKPDARNCISPIQAKTVFVIDQSDSIPDQTADEIVKRIGSVIDADVQANELVSIFQVTDGARQNLKPIFSYCKPAADGNELTENTRIIKQRFKTQFEEPLRKALASRPPVSKTSPIGEILIDISLMDELRSDRSRLVVFSDLMQNSPSTRMYGCASKDQAIAQFHAQRAGAVERPTFKNAEIRLNIIPRQGIGQAAVQCRDGFWTWFFGDNSGPNSALAKPEYLPG